MELLLVGIGGMLGSLLRFSLGRLVLKRVQGTFPWPTFLINISGAIVLGLVMSLELNKIQNIFLADGFLGAYTTFSTFMYEGFNLFSNKKTLNAVVYIISSIILGVLGYILGFWLGKNI